MFGADTRDGHVSRFASRDAKVNHFIDESVIEHLLSTRIDIRPTGNSSSVTLDFCVGMAEKIGFVAKSSFRTFRSPAQRFETVEYALA